MSRYGIISCGVGTAVTVALFLAAIVLPHASAGLITVPSEHLVPNLAGSWRLTLMGDDNVTREVNLTLSQVDRDLYGNGNLTAAGETRSVVSVGFLEGDVLNLYLIDEGWDSFLRLSFSVVEDPISGNCIGYSFDDDGKMTGKVIGSGSGSKYISGETAAGFGPKPIKKTKSGTTKSSSSS